MTNSRVAASAAISPDGRRLAFAARDASGKTLLYVRPLDALAAQPIAGTEDATLPFWSPDSRFIAYFAGSKLMKIDASGGPAQTLCVCIPGGNRGGAWSRDNVIVFNAGPGTGLMRVSSAGGQATPATPVAQFGQTFPSFLPDGRHLLLYGVSASEETNGVYVASLETGEAKQLLPASSGAVYDKRSGHLLFVRAGTLLAQPFNPNTLALSGEPFPIGDRVEFTSTPGIMAFSVSDTGALAYGVGLGGAAELQIVAVDRQGKVIANIGPPGNYRGLDLSPDGTRLATHRHDGTGGDIWVTDLARGTTTRVTFDPQKDNASPVWSPDSKRVVFATWVNGKYGLAQKAVDGGSEEAIYESEAGRGRPMQPMTWSPDATRIVYFTAGQRSDLEVISLDDRKPAPLLNTTFVEGNGQISPDGKWLAYMSNENTQMEIYVQSFPALGAKLQISTGMGLFPRWRRDGRELFYMNQPRGTMFKVDIESVGGSLRAGPPQALFESGYVVLPHTGPFHGYAVSPDGQRFYIPRPMTASPEEAAQAPIVVVHNWYEGTKR
jgi:Tol biopolymer transport system component